MVAFSCVIENNVCVSMQVKMTKPDVAFGKILADVVSRKVDLMPTCTDIVKLRALPGMTNK